MDVKESIWALLVVVFTFSVHAADDVISGLNSSIQPFINKISLVVGGIFGIYFILLIIRIWYERKKVKILMDVRYDLDRLNQSQGLPYSKQKKAFSKFIQKIKNFFEFHRENKAIQRRYKQREKWLS